MSQALEPIRKRQIRMPVGLLLSIGSPKPERGPGRPLDHFRPKEGQLTQFAAEAAKFTQVYGDQPKQLPDLFFLSNDVPSILDIRLLAFSQTGIRGVGATNYAEIVDESEFEERVFGPKAFIDDFTFFPKDVSEVRPEMKETWEGEPVEGRLEGRSDPRVDRLQVKVVASLEFCLPEVMGLGKVARISTSSRNSIRNLWKGLWTDFFAFNGNLSGPMFRLTVRPRSTQRFEKAEKKYVQTTVYELVLDTPHTISELRAAIEEHRKTLGAPTKEQLRLEGRAMKQTLALPAPSGEEQTREEAVAAVPDWLLNKLAQLESEIPDDARRAMLLGVFGVEDSRELDPEQAERYWRMLEAALPAEDVEGEIVNGETEGSAPEAPFEEVGASEGGGADAAADDALTASADTPTSAPSSSADSGAEPGPSHITAASGLGVDAPDASAPEPLPGEPVEGYADPIEAAAELLCPIGGNRGARIDELPEDWLKWALQNGRHFSDYAEFYSGLEFYVQHRKPEIWEAVRG